MSQSCRALLPVLVAALLSLGACSTELPQLAPLFRDAHGVMLDSAQWRGRWVVLNYWAAWCAPCAEEVPELNRLAVESAGQLLVLGVNLDGQQGHRLLADMAALGINFPVLAEDPGPALRLSVIRAVPTTFLLDPQGRLQHTLLGPHDAAQLRAVMGLPLVPAEGIE